MGVCMCYMYICVMLFLSHILLGGVSTIPDTFHAILKIISDKPSVYIKMQHLQHDNHIG